jgi:AAA+ ATPase superfamily predicted ATPase
MVGREYEIKRLKESLLSDSSELIAVYGRRRIGKTYLIRNVYEREIKFEVTGLYRGKMENQLAVFLKELKRVSNKFSKIKELTNWDKAFDSLEVYIKGLRGKGKKVIFIDEFPWFDNHKSGFLMYFSQFWNTFCEKRNDLLVVICGSAASYMIQNIVKNRGSLHARLTYKVQLKPFTLYEAKLFLTSKNINWSNYNILHMYIAIGGIPHYLNKIKKGESVVQNIQRLCFDSNGDLANEYIEIFESLFEHSNTHIQIVKVLGKSNRGITRDELIKQTGYSGGGHFTKAIEELIASGFVSDYPAIGRKKKMTLYRLSDEYSRFYLKYIESNKNQGKLFWKTMSQQRSYISWAGFNFETICLKHVAQIKKALGIEGIHSVNSSWTAKGAQVDLVISRNDRWINLCEMKFYSDQFVIGANEIKNLRNKITKFKENTKTRDTVVLTMITTYGVVKNEYFYEIVEDNLTIDILFEPV